MKELFQVFFLLFFLFIAIVGLVSVLEYYSCNDFAELNSSYQVEYRWPAGCMVKMDDIWLNTDKVYYDTKGIVIDD